MINLIGILVVAVGFALRFNTLIVVIAAGIVTGLVSGMSFHEVVALFGKYFVENRYMTLPVVLMVPVIGVLERYGMQERAEKLIRGAKAATAGRVLLLYGAIRQASISIGVNIGGHAAAVRPLVAPMAEAAARAKFGVISDRLVYRIRAHAAAAENVGNFFGEDIFVAVGAVQLMRGFLATLKIDVSLWSLAVWGIPPALVAFVALAWRLRALDASIEKGGARTP